jgi:hypothetical protein
MLNPTMPSRFFRLAFLSVGLALAGCATETAPTQAPQPQGIDMNGRWMLSNGVQTCAVTFVNADAGSGTVRPEGGCPGDLFKARQWVLENGRVQVRDHQGQPLAGFGSGGTGFQGEAANGQALTLVRAM